MTKRRDSERRDRPGGAVRSDSTSGELIELGRIVNLHGVRGEVRILPYNPDSLTLLQSSSLYLTGADGLCVERRVTSARRHKTFVLACFEGVSSANDAETLVGCGVAVPRSALPPPGPAAAYHADLIGCAVCTTAGEALGTVQEMIVTGSNDVCVVRGFGREVLVPMVADVIAALDTEKRTIVVHPLPGLLEA